MVGGEDGESIHIASNLLKRNSHVFKRINIRTRWDFKLDAQVDGCDIILDIDDRKILYIDDIMNDSSGKSKIGKCIVGLKMCVNWELGKGTTNRSSVNQKSTRRVAWYLGNQSFMRRKMERDRKEEEAKVEIKMKWERKKKQEEKVREDREQEE